MTPGEFLTEDSLVLEVGSGSNPWPRSDVLLDRFYVDETGQRGGTDIYRDSRPMVVAAGERLPFKTKAFDYAYTCHVIEHAEEIASMLDEMSRVAKAGFIECPNPLLERILDQEQHNWYIANRNDELLIVRKNHDTNRTTRIDKFYFHIMSDHFLVRHNWPMFVTRLHWTGSIRYRITDDVEEVFDAQYINPDLPAAIQRNLRNVLWRAWKDAVVSDVRTGLAEFKPAISLRNIVRSARKVARRRRAPRLQGAAFDKLLACPQCRAELQRNTKGYDCAGCGRSFVISDDVAVLL